LGDATEARNEVQIKTSAAVATFWPNKPETKNFQVNPLVACWPKHTRKKASTDAEQLFDAQSLILDFAMNQIA
jgi:hypothetical protein